MKVQLHTFSICPCLACCPQAPLSFNRFAASRYGLTHLELKHIELAKKLAMEASLRFAEKKNSLVKQNDRGHKIKKFFNSEPLSKTGSLTNEQKPVDAPFPQGASGEGVQSQAGVLPPTKEQVINQLSGVAKKWVFKVVPKILPAVKPVFKAIKIAKTIFSLGRSISEKDILGTVKKIVSLAIKAIGSLVGGVFFEIFDTLKKVAKWTKLIAETVEAVKNAIWYLREGSDARSQEVQMRQVAALEECPLCTV